MAIKFDILSLFPDYFKGPFDVSIIGRAREKGLIEINLVDIREFAEGRHSQVDDRPYGGGPGMVLMPGPVARAVRSRKTPDSHVIYLTPQGAPLTAEKSRELAGKKHLVFLCGHYEGIDERAIDLTVDEEISVGDVVLTSGCPAAITCVDAISRFIPGVVGKEEGVRQDSFEQNIFDTPHYTRPEEFEGLTVPKVLLQGHHAKIEAWRYETAKQKTKRVRPDLLVKESN
ncbi:MAG: tRNA (guanine-N(1)-)-methyltransferase [Chlamydiia bacterium]|nr:tRNA (guanine-N(1)-)-methyltransferase [Chlamydiia bacterium]MCH9615949.1 tRNA (guanine-N(1)-)-methyltransferase [Chlamydiia bacterium]MCH9628648.1 tRNA (guanine-N(1)-)-methyltransferase [Chlamydiia bacterium]